MSVSLSVEFNLFFSHAVDRRVFGGDVVSQYTLLSVCGLHLTAHAGESPDPLRFYGPLSHHPLQNRILQITFLAHQTVGERTTFVPPRGFIFFGKLSMYWVPTGLYSEWHFCAQFRHFLWTPIDVRD